MVIRTVEQKAAILFVGNIGNSLPGWGTRLYPKAALFYNDPGGDIVKTIVEWTSLPPLRGWTRDWWRGAAGTAALRLLQAFY
jgi:hypothetical protein